MPHTTAERNHPHGREERQEGQGQSAEAESRQTGENRKAEAGQTAAPNPLGPGPTLRVTRSLLNVAPTRLVGRLAGKCSRRKGLVWSHTVCLSPGSSGRTAAESHGHLYSLDHPGQPIAFPRISDLITSPCDIKQEKICARSDTLSSESDRLQVQVMEGGIISENRRMDILPSLSLVTCTGGRFSLVLATGRLVTNGTMGFTEVRASQIHACRLPG